MHQPFDIDPLRALPHRLYRDPEVYAAELERIWHRDWVFVGTEADLPSAGARFPAMVGSTPVLLVRDEQGDLVALSNLCAHRGTLLVDKPCRGGKVVCPYHAWTYDLEGKLVGVPHDPEGRVDRDQHSLRRFRVESWHGLLFVSLDSDIEPLTERFALVEPYLQQHGIESLTPWPQEDEEEAWSANWKLVIANAMESYHIFCVHRDTLQPMAPASGAYYVAGSARCTATGGKVPGSNDYLLVSLPPAFVGMIYPGAFLWQAVAPLGRDRTRVFTGGSFRASPPGRRRIRRWLGRASAALGGYTLPNILPEDRHICERAQRGAVGDFEPGVLLPIERVVRDFHHYWDWRLNGTPPPAPHIATAPSDSPGSARSERDAGSPPSAR